MTPAGSDAIASYYDNLSRFLDFARRVGRGGGSAQGSTHRFLAGNRADETPDPERLDRLVLETARALGLPPNPRVLDAGCGLGGTIFHWHTHIGGDYVGLTLSGEQRRRAAAEAMRRGASDRCRFYMRSYHEPLSGSYDAVIAIESLAHSADPRAALLNLAQGLAPGGLLLIVDDMPQAQARGSLLAGFKEGWRCPVLLDARSYIHALTDAGLEIVHEEDLTSRLRPRPLPWLKLLIAVLSLARRLAPVASARDVIGALLGGFILEALYRTGGMHYRLMAARKPG